MTEKFTVANFEHYSVIENYRDTEQTQVILDSKTEDMNYSVFNVFEEVLAR